MNLTGVPSGVPSSLTNPSDIAIPLAVAGVLSFLAIKVGQCALRALPSSDANALPPPPAAADIPPPANDLLPPPPADADAPTGPTFEEIDPNVQLPLPPLDQELKVLVNGLLTEPGNPAGDTDNDTLSRLQGLIEKGVNPHKQETEGAPSTFRVLFDAIVEKHGHYEVADKVEPQLIKALLILANSKTHQLTNENYEISTYNADVYGFPNFLRALNTITYVNWMKKIEKVGGADDPFKDLFTLLDYDKTPFFLPYYEGTPLQILAINLGLKTEMKRLIFDPAEKRNKGINFSDLARNHDFDEYLLAHSPIGHKVPSHDNTSSGEVTTRPAGGSYSTSKKKDPFFTNLMAELEEIPDLASRKTPDKLSDPSGKVGDSTQTERKPKEEALSVKPTSTPIALDLDPETCAAEGIAKGFTEPSEEFKSLDDYLIYAVENKIKPETIGALFFGFSSIGASSYLYGYYDNLCFDEKKGKIAQKIIKKIQESSNY